MLIETHEKKTKRVYTSWNWGKNFSWYWFTKYKKGVDVCKAGVWKRPLQNHWGVCHAYAGVSETDPCKPTVKFQVCAMRVPETDAYKTLAGVCHAGISNISLQNPSRCVAGMYLEKDPCWWVPPGVWNRYMQRPCTCVAGMYLKRPQQNWVSKTDPCKTGYLKQTPAKLGI